MYHSCFLLWWLFGFGKILLPQLSVIDMPNERGALVGLMTSQAVRRNDAYHDNSIESSWIVSEISLSHVQQIIPRAIWTDGGHYSKGKFISTFILTWTRAITTLCWCDCKQVVFWPAWCKASCFRSDGKDTDKGPRHCDVLGVEVVFKCNVC